MPDMSNPNLTYTFCWHFSAHGAPDGGEDPLVFLQAPPTSSTEQPPRNSYTPSTHILASVKYESKVISFQFLGG